LPNGASGFVAQIDITSSAIRVCVPKLGECNKILELFDHNRGPRRSNLAQPEKNGVRTKTNALTFVIFVSDRDASGAGGLETKHLAADAAHTATCGQNAFL
jgi:hypothetical protein